jgi:hypothetical protein
MASGLYEENAGPEYGVAYTTSDNASSWNATATLTSGMDPVGTSCSTDSNCVVVGMDGHINESEVTTDGGATWTAGDFSNGGLWIMTGVSCYGSDCVADGVASIGKGLNPLYSSNGGLTWYVGGGAGGWGEVSCSGPHNCTMLAANPYIYGYDTNFSYVSP